MSDILVPGPDQPEVEFTLADHTNRLTDALALVIQIHGASVLIRKELRRQLTSYLEDADSYGVWIGKVKHLLSYPKAIFLRCSPPTEPAGGGFTPSGILRRWFKPRLHFYNGRNVHLWDTWLQGAKKATYSVPSSEVLGAFCKHRNSLGGPDPASQTDVTRIMKSRDVRYLLRIVREETVRILKERADTEHLDDYHWDDLAYDLSPSHKACFETNRSFHGPLNNLLSEGKMAAAGDKYPSRGEVVLGKCGNTTVLGNGHRRMDVFRVNTRNFHVKPDPVFQEPHGSGFRLAEKSARTNGVEFWEYLHLIYDEDIQRKESAMDKTGRHFTDAYSRWASSFNERSPFLKPEKLPCYIVNHEKPPVRGETTILHTYEVRTRGDGTLQLDGDYITVPDYLGVDGRKRWGIECVLPTGELENDLFVRDYLRHGLSDRKSILVPFPPFCTVAAVLEPLKVRLVSKGEARLYQRARVFQKAIHTAMRRMQPFRLIGETIDVCTFGPAMVDGLGTEDPSEGPQEWFNLDFSAATDGISGRLGQAIVAYLTEGLPLCGGHAVRSAFGYHTIDYPSVVLTDDEYAELPASVLAMEERPEVPDPRGVFPSDGSSPPTEDPDCPGRWLGDAPLFCSPCDERGKPLPPGKTGDHMLCSVQPFTQTNGQLMGSVVSFPILCLINAICYMKVARLSESKRSLTARELLDRVRINGDDICFRHPIRDWEAAREIYGRVGLRFSDGKCYHHPTYVQLNSRSYNIRLCDTLPEKPLSIKIFRYFNVGLFYGQHKVQKQTGESETASHSEGRCSVLNEILWGAPGRYACEILAAYIGRFSSEIKEETKIKVNGRYASRNLFLPCSLGGMGIERPSGFHSVVTEAQRSLIASLIDNRPSGSVLDTSYPARGYVPSPPIILRGKKTESHAISTLKIATYWSKRMVSKRFAHNTPLLSFSSEAPVASGLVCSAMELATLRLIAPLDGVEGSFDPLYYLAASCDGA